MNNTLIINSLWIFTKSPKYYTVQANHAFLAFTIEHFTIDRVDFDNAFKYKSLKNGKSNFLNERNACKIK